MGCWSRRAEGRDTSGPVATREPRPVHESTRCFAGVANPNDPPTDRPSDHDDDHRDDGDDDDDERRSIFVESVSLISARVSTLSIPARYIGPARLLRESVLRATHTRDQRRRTNTTRRFRPSMPATTSPVCLSFRPASDCFAPLACRQCWIRRRDYRTRETTGFHLLRFQSELCWQSGM